MAKTYQEINKRISQGDAVVLTAEEMTEMVEGSGVEKAAREVDVVTTGTFGAMCSSGAFLNFGHSDPPIRMQDITLNDVPAYAGIAAVDAYIGATQVPRGDETFRYGGGHVIEDLVSGKDIHLKAFSSGSDCYPRSEMDTHIRLQELNQAYMFNPRNGYQNYACATNSSERVLKTYMGTLKPNYGNVTFATSGELSPLLNDPEYRTIGIGTSVWLAGARGHVAWEGTQFNVNAPRSSNGVPKRPAGALALAGNLKEMDPAFLKGMTYAGYGATLGVGFGIPIPVLDEKMARATAVSNSDISTAVFDYSQSTRSRTPVREVTYRELQSGKIDIDGREVRTSHLSDLNRARTIACRLKDLVRKGDFPLTEPIRGFPIEREFKPLNRRD